MGEDIVITLLGKKLKFKADENVSDARQVAEVLTREVNKVIEKEKQSVGMDNFTKLTQAALNLANDFVELQQSYADLERRISDRSDALLQSINTRISNQS